MKSTLSALILMLSSLQLSTSSRDLSTEYSFSVDLHDNYTLYWNYDITEETISFVVRVRTEGWVGFGLSPTGQMPGSDVVIGWVDGQGNTFFHDRFAEGRFTPAIDESQDWVLEFGRQENGYTILAFNRKLTSCDPKDLNIKADTSRVVWSWHSSDPSSTESIAQHQFSGVTSVNLLGGLNNPPPEPDDKDSFRIASQNVAIPGDMDTTYWCTALQLPSEIRDKTRYIYKISPFISEGNTPYVHHVLIYLCNELNHTLVGQGAHCFNAHIDIQECRGSTIIGAWAVGGEDLLFPEDVRLPLGGVGNGEYVVIEMHYDNPLLHKGVTDSSGLEFHYTNDKALYDAGLIAVGHNVRPSMLIPPNTDGYLVEGFCHESCTQKFFPPEGITVFSNLLHTHVYGTGIRLQHFRHNKECNVTEELEPVDENLQYDFNYQQFTSLPKQVKIMPGDSLVLQCLYNTVERSTPVLGGESTREEMCFSFFYYYPKLDLSFCTSSAQAPYSFSTFADKYISESQRKPLLDGLADDNTTQFLPILEKVNWTPDAIESFQDSVLNFPQFFQCVSDNDEVDSSFSFENHPRSECPYEAPDTCSGSQPKTCCEIVQTTPSTNGEDPASNDVDNPANNDDSVSGTDGGVKTASNSIFLLLLHLFCIVLLF